jgi:hypothetical protein
MIDEELKKRMKQIEYEIHKAQSPKTAQNSPTSSKIVKSRKFPLKYKLLLWFCLGFSLFLAMGFILGPENAYLIFISLTLFFNSLILLVSTLSIATFLIILSIPTLLFLYVVWKIYKSLV